MMELDEMLKVLAACGKEQVSTRRHGHYAGLALHIKSKARAKTLSLWERSAREARRVRV